MLATFTLLLVLSAEPAPALKSLSGLNVKALKPWLVQNLPSLAKCGRGEDEVTVRAQFTSGATDVKVERIEAAKSDVLCVKRELEAWKNDSQQPRAGSFTFVYRVSAR